MKISRRWFRWSVFASILTLTVFTVAASAAEPRTAAVISIADLDSTMKSLKAVTEQAGYPDALAAAEMGLTMLQGANTKQPIGIVVQADETSFGGYAFLPISDVSATPLAQLIVMGEKQKDGSILLPPLSPVFPRLYIKQASKWLFVSVQELPSKLPDDPSKLLEGLNKQYILGVKANVGNLPKDLTTTGLILLRNFAEQQAKTNNDIEVLDSQFEQIETLLTELKTFVFGIAITPENNIVIDTITEAASGTTLAGDIVAAANAKTNWMGFYQPKDTIFSFVDSSVINAQVKKQFLTQTKAFFEGAREGIKEGDTEIDLETAALVLENLQAVLASSLESGKLDFGATWKSDGTFLAGLSISDGKKLQTALEKIVAAVPEEFKQYIKLNDSKLGDYSVSTIVAPLSALPTPEEMPKELADKTVKLYIAVKDNASALSLGLTDTVLDDLKKAIDASQTATSLPETRAVATLGRLADFITLLAPTPLKESDAQLLETLAGLPKDPQIAISVKFEGNTKTDKIVISNALLPVFGKLIGASQTVAQDAARRMKCVNNLKELAIAMHNYHDVYNNLPPAYTADKDGKPLHSWRVLILPFIEQSELYEQIRLNEPWDSEWNKQFHNVVIPQYHCPSDSSSSSSANANCNYSVVVGKETPFTGSKSVKFGEITDGTSNTLLVIERSDSVCWMNPTQELTFDRLIKNGIVVNEDLMGGEHIGGVNAALCDGSVHFLPETLDLETLKALLIKNDGKVVDLP
ncbi:MAG: DUF1559 domain-containing protein [Planctomycetaceae bacterium]|jgi:hypothetical protein|nr:DUF1559 domain-containing protein [Planctomycetaceae bacterium]